MVAVCVSCRKTPTTLTPSPSLTEGEGGVNHKPSNVDVEKIVDMKIPDLDRNPFSLTAEIARHEITIIDFWASWCGPCRQEAPRLVNAYKLYKDKGLGIIGISLDEEYDDWRAAIGQLGLTWPQVSELRGWDDTTARHYGVSAIPYTIVVSRDGTILARGLRGTDLETFVAQQLKE